MERRRHLLEMLYRSGTLEYGRTWRVKLAIKR